MRTLIRDSDGDDGGVFGWETLVEVPREEVEQVREVEEVREEEEGDAGIVPAPTAAPSLPEPPIVVERRRASSFACSPNNVARLLLPPRKTRSYTDLFADVDDDNLRAASAAADDAAGILQSIRLEHLDLAKRKAEEEKRKAEEAAAHDLALDQATVAAGIAELERLAPEGSLTALLLEEAASFEGLGLDSAGFERILRKYDIFQGDVHGYFRRRFYDACDRNQDHLVEFAELAQSLGVFVHGTDEERLAFVFEICDTDHSGGIAREELRSFLTPAAREMRREIAAALEHESQLVGLCGSSLEKTKLAGSLHCEGKSTISFQEASSRRRSSRRTRSLVTQQQQLQQQQRQQRGRRRSTMSARQASPSPLLLPRRLSGATIPTCSRGSFNKVRAQSAQRADNKRGGRGSRGPTSPSMLKPASSVPSPRSRHNSMVVRDSTKDSSGEAPGIVSAKVLEKEKEEESGDTPRRESDTSDTDASEASALTSQTPYRPKSKTFGDGDDESSIAEAPAPAPAPAPAGSFFPPLGHTTTSSQAPHRPKSRTFGDGDDDDTHTRDDNVAETPADVVAAAGSSFLAPIVPSAAATAAQPAAAAFDRQKAACCHQTDDHDGDGEAQQQRKKRPLPKVFITVKNAIGNANIQLEKGTLLAMRKSENSAEEVARIESSILDALLEDCFLHNDDNGDGELTVGEFCNWAGATDSLGTILKHLHLQNY